MNTLNLFNQFETLGKEGFVAWFTNLDQKERNFYMRNYAKKSIKGTVEQQTEHLLEGMAKIYNIGSVFSGRERVKY